MASNYPNMGANPLGGNMKPVDQVRSMATDSSRLLQNALSLEKTWKDIAKHLKEANAAYASMTGGTNNTSSDPNTQSVLQRLKTGNGTITDRLFNRNQDSSTQQVVNQLQASINQQLPLPRALGSRIGAGFGSAMAIAAGMMPNTNEAVTQRLLTQGVGSMIGMDPNKLTAMTNKMLAGGITGPYSAQASMSILASQGILPTMGSFSNIMGQTAGLSVLTGMQNEQVASAFGGINGMNFLQVGIRARDAKGNLRAPEAIANDLYRRTYGGNRKLTEAQAAQVFNVHSRSYQNIMAVSGGDANLAANLQEMMYYQGKGGGARLNVSDAQNVKDNILKLRKDDISRAQWNYQGSEANKLQATGNGLVGGYSAALDATASVNNGMAGLANMLPQVTNALGNLKGFLDTLPTAGNTGATMFGGGMGLAGHAGNFYMMHKMSKGLSALERSLMGGAETAGGTAALTTGEAAAGATGVAALAAKLSGSTASGLLGGASRTVGGGLEAAIAKGGFSAARMIPALAAAGGTYYGLSKLQNKLQQYGRDHHLPGAVNAFGNEAFNTGKYAATGAAAGLVLGGPVGAAAGAVLGTAYGVGHNIYDFATGNWGRGAGGVHAAPDPTNHNKPKDVKSDLPRNARQAANWAINQVNTNASGWHNYCEKFVESAWGRAGRYESAIAHWNIAVREKRAHHGKDAPPGAFVFWGGGQYGHTAISIGDGKVVSTDILRRGKADIVHIDTITKRWGKPYLGWTDPSKRTVLDPKATPINPKKTPHEVGPVSKSSGETPSSTEQNSPWYKKAINSLTSSFGGSASSSSQSMGSSVAIASEAVGITSVASTASLLGFGAPSGTSGPGYSGGEININMTVNIGSSNHTDIQKLAREIRTAIDKEMRVDKVRGF